MHAYLAYLVSITVVTQAVHFTETAHAEEAWMALDVLAIGVCTVDLIVRVPAFPRVDGRMEVLDLTQAIGGNAAVAAAALGRLGAHVGFAGVVGNDAHGDLVRTGLREAGVDLTLLDTVDGINTVTTVIISDVSTGTR